MGLKFSQRGQRGERPVGDDQRPAQTLLQQMPGHMLARAGAEPNRGGKRKAMQWVHRWISSSDDLKVTLQSPIGNAVEPLAPFPFARGGKVLDEGVAQPVMRHAGMLQNARGLDQGA